MKRFGVSAFDSPSFDNNNNNKTSSIDKKSIELDEQLQIFQGKLVEFSKKHNAELQKNPNFRSKFLSMCSKIGVDPLNLYDKDTHLFNVDDFYYEICCKIVKFTRILNSGIISFKELLNKIQIESQNTNINLHDIEKAINMLLTLDSGFEIITLKQNKKFLKFLPIELTVDQFKILEICSILGYASISLLKANLSWKSMRCKAILNEMVANGLLWIDDQDSNELLYWDPSWITRSIN
ncbi:hypothetical protein KAFR_0B01880 [Kazachstania africana CBS 2517]|uniref:Vacuolar-sorting protein SNF8 n=1 Tax=Kazachstania africana (strain ATCC 22294 / BCRC 22015 / CBS 2517 / CECT 1963 / NBRC 1671 / NRRL Y-8276) TaxID=1071382 RepID=H2AQ37_KAZAF|nr:hypothetical protein KAFR_0B01880 [Kazachstania africana CBS 2517]CCF56487.1 hypothetical protein KAFR_0B01880 [Kazachstania africana CBS 2517]